MELFPRAIGNLPRVLWESLAFAFFSRLVKQHKGISLLTRQAAALSYLIYTIA